MQHNEKSMCAANAVRASCVVCCYSIYLHHALQLYCRTNLVARLTTHTTCLRKHINKSKHCINACRFLYRRIFGSCCLYFLSASRRILVVARAEYTTLIAPRARTLQCSRRNPKHSSKALLTHSSNCPHKAMALTVRMGRLGSGTCHASRI